MRKQRTVLGLALVGLLFWLSGCDDVQPRPQTDVEDAETTEGIVDICGDRRCAATETCCDGVCIDLSVDESNCGICGQQCEGTETCSNGSCICAGPLGVNSVCEDALACCLGFGCVNVDTDPFNCGGCGVRCGAGEQCEGGQCQCGTESNTSAVCSEGTVCCGNPASCAAPESDACNCGGVVCAVGEVCCDDSCVRLDRNVDNCGSCGSACGAAERCVNGFCSCQFGFYDCDQDAANGCETRVSSDHENCGACGRQCNSGEVCSLGQCVQSCQAWETNCSGSCVEIQSDSYHCGSCQRPCESGEVCSYYTCATSCQGNLNNCGGSCVNLQTDRYNCGNCGRECPSGEVCWGGFCALSCPSHLQRCGDTCVNLEGDARNCGGCFRSCEPGEVCASGTCAVECPSGQLDCNSSCVDPLTDRLNCGACDAACGSGEVCVQGECQISCPSGQFACDALCVDPLIDPAYCGGSNCFDGDVCLENEACEGGSCVCGLDFEDCNDNLDDGCEAHLPTDEAHCGACFAPCAAGDTCCSGVCLDRETDVLNCGECGLVCPAVANALPLCSHGKCGFECQPGFGDCDGDPSNGCEQDLLSDLNHCGICDNLCAAINSTASCVEGSCTLDCDEGFSVCDGRVDTGCETNIASDLENCGGCGLSCGSQNAEPMCIQFACVPNCLEGWGDCDGDPANGCETPIATDVQNCGGCGVVCSNNNATPACEAGGCVPQCEPGFLNCNEDIDDGCEVDIFNDPLHCGGCGLGCDSLNATTSCSEGLCTPICDAEYGDCDGDGRNGCETELIENDQHCGACGNTCNDINADFAYCDFDSCYLECSYGFEDCDGDPNNGCETFIEGDPRNCGACGSVCAPINGAAFCGGGFEQPEANKDLSGREGPCQLFCDWDFEDCDADASNGCETNIMTIDNCGGCGYKCGSDNTLFVECLEGCYFECLPDFEDCDWDPQNGCEAALMSDPFNCGECGVICSDNGGTPICNVGACETACAARREDCDGDWYNGCEVDTDTDAQNCGSCGTLCSVMNGESYCDAGVCAIDYCYVGYEDDPTTPDPDCDLYVGS